MSADRTGARRSTFVGGVFAAGAFVIGADMFRPLFRLVTRRQVTLSLEGSDPEGTITGPVRIAATSTKALVDAGVLGGGTVALYTLGTVLLALGMVGIAVGYATFIGTAGEAPGATPRRGLVIASSGLVAVVGATVGAWCAMWAQRIAASGTGITQHGYEVADRTSFVMLVAGAVLIMISLLTARTQQLEQDTAGLV